MNCANHPERTATAFCQNCGKALCPECTRIVDGLVLCEPCLLLRQSGAAGWSAIPAGAAAAGSWSGGTASPSSAGPAGSAASVATGAAQAGYSPVPNSSVPHAYGVPYAGGSPASPVLAGLLGFIPGVGAMYNGQFIKALLHVVIFIVLVGATEHFDLAGLLIPAWIFYQVFDAAQTASARRDGRPLPDPFGILDMSQRLGSQNPVYPPVQRSAPYVPPAAPPPSGAGPSQAYAAPPAAAAYVPVSPPVPANVPARHSEPIGAIVLIVVGLLFLLSTLGVLDVDWIGRGWPLLIVLLGVWLLIRRARTPVGSMAAPYTPPPTGPYAAPVQPASQPGTALARNPLSITSAPEPERGEQPSREEDNR